jgi:hypothetical protein
VLYLSVIFHPINIIDMAYKRRRSSKSAESTNKRKKLEARRSEEDPNRNHKTKKSSRGDDKEEILIHAFPASAPSSSDLSSVPDEDGYSPRNDENQSSRNDEESTPSPDHPLSSYSNEDVSGDDLTHRISAAVLYTRVRRAAGLPVESVTRFHIPIHPPHPSLALLRHLSNEAGRGGTGLAHFIYADAVHEVYELGAPGPVQQDGVDPRWFHRQSRAEVRAGPYAEEANVRAANAVLIARDTRAANAARKSGGRKTRQFAIETKLAEGMRRQETGMKMSDSSSEEDETGSSGLSSVPEYLRSSSDSDDLSPVLRPRTARPRATRSVILSSSDSDNVGPVSNVTHDEVPPIQSSTDEESEIDAPSNDRFRSEDFDDQESDINSGDEEDADEDGYADVSSEEESEEEVVAPRRSGRIRVQRRL